MVGVFLEFDATLDAGVVSKSTGTVKGSEGCPRLFQDFEDGYIKI